MLTPFVGALYECCQTVCIVTNLFIVTSIRAFVQPKNSFSPVPTKPKPNLSLSPILPISVFQTRLCTIRTRCLSPTRDADQPNLSPHCFCYLGGRPNVVGMFESRSLDVFPGLVVLLTYRVAVWQPRRTARSPSPQLDRTPWVPLARRWSMSGAPSRSRNILYVQQHLSLKLSLSASLTVCASARGDT